MYRLLMLFHHVEQPVFHTLLLLHLAKVQPKFLFLEHFGTNHLH
jgi:hypothetical protein